MYTASKSFEQLTAIEMNEIIGPCFADGNAWIDPDMVPAVAAVAAGQPQGDLVHAVLRELWDSRAAHTLCHRQHARTVSKRIGLGQRKRAGPTSPANRLANGGFGGEGPSRQRCPVARVRSALLPRRSRSLSAAPSLAFG